MKKHLGVLCLFASAFAPVAITTITLPAFAQTNTFPSSGSVGIGTLSPATYSPLDIYWPYQAYATVQTTASTGTPAGLEIVGPSTGAHWKITTNGDNLADDGSITVNGDDLLFMQPGTSSGAVFKMMIQGDTGNVGIWDDKPVGAASCSWRRHSR